MRPIVTGQQAWCQLFSEPGAGSDLAGLTAKAVKDGGELWPSTGSDQRGTSGMPLPPRS